MTPTIRVRAAGVDHPHRPADDRRVAAEALLPRAVTQGDDGRGASDIILRAQGAADHRAAAEHVEEIPGDQADPDRIDVVVHLDRRRHGAPEFEERDARQRAGASLEVAHAVQRKRNVRRTRIRRAAPEQHETVLIRNGQPPDQQRVRDREHGRGQADAERQREDRRRGEGGRPHQTAGGEADLLHHRDHQRSGARVAGRSRTARNSNVSAKAPGRPADDAAFAFSLRMRSSKPWPRTRRLRACCEAWWRRSARFHSAAWSSKST